MGGDLGPVPELVIAFALCVLGGLWLGYEIRYARAGSRLRWLGHGRELFLCALLLVSGLIGGAHAIGRLID